MCDSEGAPLYYEGTVHDITRRKRAEDALRESQRFIQRVADTSPAILYVYDLLEGRYLYVNHQVDKVLGYSVEDFVGMAPVFITDLAHPDDKFIVQERAVKLATAEDGEIFETCVRLKGANGRWLWIQSRDTVFTRTVDGRPEQIIGMAQDVSASKQSQEALEQSREQLRALSMRLQQVREEERAAIAREVHDELGQMTTALNMEVSRMRNHFTRSQGEPEREVAERLASMENVIDAMLQTVRRISAQLRPPLLDEFGLEAAIQWQAREFQKRYGLRCEVRFKGACNVEPMLSNTIIRIIQETLTNVARHAKASKVLIQTRQTEDLLVLVVKDNGRGITEGEQSASLGLLGMRERAHLFGGEIEIEGVPAGGTTVTLRMPVAKVTAQDGSQTLNALKTFPKKESLWPIVNSAPDGQ